MRYVLCPSRSCLLTLFCSFFFLFINFFAFLFGEGGGGGNDDYCIRCICGVVCVCVCVSVCVCVYLCVCVQCIRVLGVYLYIFFVSV